MKAPLNTLFEINGTQGPKGNRKMSKHHSLLTLMLSVFLLAGGLSACCEPLADDNYEPNDYPEQAYPIGFNDPIEARVTDESSDFYSVIVGEPTDLWVLVTLDSTVREAFVGIEGPDGVRDYVTTSRPWSCNPQSDECPEEGYSSYDGDGLIYKVFLPAHLPGEYIISVATPPFYCGLAYSCGKSTPYTLLLSEEEPETE